ncbi:aluminum activated malate transporter-domain-containing protein [Chlamydoabsidia padenii]|nr:aluminum activated malate transporter-domain-containing protein [Chlamydoabsidia padenii]
MFTAVSHWFDRVLRDHSNRYALQVAIAYTIGSLFVIVPPINRTFSNTVWVSFTIVMVLDNTVGGIANLSIRRVIGTVIGGVAAMIGMTIIRLIFNTWTIGADIVLACYFFIQVFWIAKLKHRPALSNACSIGLLTTAVIGLSGYTDLTHDNITASVVLASWRILCVILGIIIALISSLCVFPVQASRSMRTNIGTALEETADLFEQAADYYLELNATPPLSVEEDERIAPSISVASILSRTPQPSRAPSPHHSPPPPPTDPITTSCDKALKVLNQLQTEATRMQNVSSEYYLQLPLHLFRRERCRRDLLRAARYTQAINSMKRIVWPLVSYRLLLPLVQLGGPTVHQRITPTQSTLQSFQDSLTVMRRLGAMLKDRQRRLREHPDWYILQRLVNKGQAQIQLELAQVVGLGVDNDGSLDGLKLISYYGFLVRSAMIWEGLNDMVDQLGPQWHSRRSSITTLNPLDSTFVLDLSRH